MKKFIGYILLTLIVVSCGAPNGYFRIKGRLRNFNQGEFYIYSTDGGISDRDTIRVSDGRFSYETPLDKEATFMIVFPNFSEQPVFGQSGATVEMTGDASHLKEIEIKGTDANKQMTEFRLNANSSTPPEVMKSAADFIKEHPTSIVSSYLLRKYFIEAARPDYTKAYELITLICNADKDNVRAGLLQKSLLSLKTSAPGNRLPSFSTKDIKGENVSNSDIKSKVNVVTVWASWNYESQNIQRELKRLKKDYGNRLAIMSICIDASQKDCERVVTADSIQWHTICDGKMWDTPILKQFGLATVPGNIITDNGGKVIGRNLPLDKLREIIKKSIQ